MPLSYVTLCDDHAHTAIRTLAGMFSIPLEMSGNDFAQDWCMSGQMITALMQVRIGFTGTWKYTYHAFIIIYALHGLSIAC
jgi:hypothetical protein